MTDLSAAYIAAGSALGASTLTLFGTYGLEQVRERRNAKGARSAAKLAIYTDLLTSTASIIRAFASMRAFSDFSSKWLFGWRQLTKTAPAQPAYMDVVAVLEEPTGRLMDAWSRALLLFDQDEIDAVNKLMSAAQQFDLSVPPNDTNSMEMLLGAARREFAEFARVKLGESAARVGLPPADKE